MEQNPGETIESKYQDDQFKQNCITKCIKFKLSKNLKKQRLYRFFWKSHLYTIQYKETNIRKGKI